MPRVEYEVVHRVTRVSGGVRVVRDQDGGTFFREGVVTTPLGMVEVSLWPRRDGGEDCLLSTVINGREYRRFERRGPSEWLTARGAKTVAHRWIKQLQRDLACEND